MLAALNWIVDTIKLLINIVISTVQNLIMLFSMLPDVLAMPLTLQAVVPSLLGVSVVVIVAVGVVKLILGWGNT